MDVKVTVWNRIRFTDDTDMQKIVDMLLVIGFDEAIDGCLGFIESETLLDSEERMEPVENAGASTIEVYRAGKLIWQNGNKLTG